MFHQYSVVANSSMQSSPSDYEGLRRKSRLTVFHGENPANMRSTQRKRIKPVASHRCAASRLDLTMFPFLDRHFTCAFGRGRVSDVLRVRDMSGEKCVTFCWRKKFTDMKIVGSMMRIDRRSKRCYCTQSTNKNTENFQYKTCFFNYEG